VPRGFVLLFEVAISAAYAASGVKVFFVTTAIDAACAFRSLGALFRLNALQVKNLRHYCLLSHLAVRALRALRQSNFYCFSICVVCIPSELHSSVAPHIFDKQFLPEY